uniref:neuroblast differentiation-associated protein AHNAK n=1 Tax=Semicossyphus pulcher TaxID=241346 RepID=UPI0037E93135
MSMDRSISESLVLDDSADGVVIRGITDDKVAAKSGLQAGDEIVAATIHLDHLNKNEVLNILKVLEPYDNNMKVLTKKELSTSAGLGSLGLGLKDPAEMLNLKKNLSLDASADAPNVSLNGLGRNVNAGQGLEGEISGPTLNGDLPNLSTNKPSADAGAKFTLPSLGLTGPDVKGDLDGTVRAPDVSVSTPQLNTPSASVGIEKPGIKKGKVKYDPPKFTMPQFNMSKPKAEADVSGDIDIPKVDLNADHEANSGRMKWPWKKPNLHWHKSDPNLDAPEVPKVEGGINGPNVDTNLPDLDRQTPNVNVDAPSRKINWPHRNWNKPKLHSPKSNFDTNADLNTPNLNLSAPKIEGDIIVPNSDLKIPKADLKGPGLDVQNPGVDIDPPSGKINWPHLKWKKPKFHGPKADMDLNADVSKPDFNSSAPKFDGDITTPKADLNVEAPDANIDAPSGKIKFPTLKKPKFLLSGNGKSPDVDLDCDVPNVDVNAPNADIDAPSGKFKWPTLRKPKWSVSGPKVNGPDVDLDADVSGPKIDGELNVPHADLEDPKIDINAPDVGGPSGKFKGLTLPKFGTLKGPKADIDADLNGPKLDLKAPDLKAPVGNLSAPKIEGGIEAPDLNVRMPNADIKGPDVDVKSPDLSLDSPDSKLKFPKFKLPKFKGPKVKGPELDADLKAPDIDASLDLPKVDVDAPNVDLKAPDLSLSATKIKGGVDAPDLDKDISGKYNMPDLKMPKFNMGRTKTQLPDAELKTPDVSVPDANIKLPTADVNAPNLNVSGPTIKGDLSSSNLDLDAGLNTDVDLKAPKSNISLPTIDMNLPNAHVKEASLDMPKADFKGPDAQLKTPDLDFDSSLGDFKLPHFKLPKLGLSDTDVEVPSGPSVKSGVETPQVNIATPSADADTSVPAVDWSLPKVEGDIGGSKVDVETPNVDANIEKSKLPHFKLPKFKFPGSKVNASEVDTSANLEVPSVEGELNSPDVSVSGPEGGISLNNPNLGITAEADAEVKGSPKSKLRWPFSWGRKSGTDEEGSGVESDTDVSNTEVEVPAFKFHKLPRNSMDGVEGIADTLGLAKLDTDAKDYVVSKGVRLPIINATSKPGEKIDIMQRLKMAKEKVPSVNSSPTEAKSDLDLKLVAPSLDVNASSEAVDSSLVRGGTFKVEKPALAISTSENDKMSLGLSNMLGLNIKDSDAD